MKIQPVHISEIRVGDTIVHNGQHRTVCRRAFSYNPFIGTLLWGESYNMGNNLVQRVIFPKYYQGKRLN